MFPGEGPRVKTEKEKMLAGELYRSGDPELIVLRQRARRLTRLYNQTSETESERRLELLKELFGQVGPRVEIEPPFQCDYGENIHAGDGLYLNFGCVLLDCARIDIGANCFLAPGVHLYAAFHPLDAATRNSGLEYAKPIRIGDNCWLGGHVTVCPGVSIGDNTVIGAGSVVVRNIPANVVAAGNPCRALRAL